MSLILICDAVSNTEIGLSDELSSIPLQLRTSRKICERACGIEGDEVEDHSQAFWPTASSVVSLLLIGSYFLSTQERAVERELDDIM